MSEFHVISGHKKAHSHFFKRISEVWTLGASVEVLDLADGYKRAGGSLVVNARYWD
ncbi:hypothetical protein D1AOALGA4SA_3691 [Olavius algarvensis Delta 1 endosymbiont]|nr:hypothetical protein D1AOALGA4SA_3691 [Olavius algarvensis Delta 1 endosymbiont]